MEPGSGLKVVKVRHHNEHTYASVATSDAKTKDSHTSKSVSVKFGEATVDRTGNTESALMASSTMEGANSIEAVMEPLQTVSKYSWLLFIPALDSQPQFWICVLRKTYTSKFYIAANVDTTGNTESSLMASSRIEGANSIQVVKETLQSVSKYFWLLFVPNLDSQHQFWKSVLGKYVNFRMFNNLVSKFGFYIDNSLIHMTMTSSKYFNINLLVLFFSSKYLLLYNETD